MAPTRASEVTEVKRGRMPLVVKAEVVEMTSNAETPRARMRTECKRTRSRLRVCSTKSLCNEAQLARVVQADRPRDAKERIT